MIEISIKKKKTSLVHLKNTEEPVENGQQQQQSETAGPKNEKLPVELDWPFASNIQVIFSLSNTGSIRTWTRNR